MILDIDESRYSKRAVNARKRLIRNFILLIIICLIAYKMGYESVKSHEQAYKKQVENTQKDRREMENIITSLRSKLQSSTVLYNKLVDEYNANVPKGNHKYLSDLIKHQMDRGITAERLAYLIRSTSPPQNCSKPITKRFVMVTSTYKGPRSGISFANGAIEIIGEGEAAVNSRGKAEAWYDPSKKVSVTFKIVGDKIINKEGLLPIYHSTILNGKEYRFTLAKGEQSFLNVTSDHCDYP